MFPAGLVVINNVAQMERALASAEDMNTHDVLVSLIGVGSALGRMTMGYLCNVLLVPRIILLIPVQVSSLRRGLGLG